MMSVVLCNYLTSHANQKNGESSLITWQKYLKAVFLHKGIVLPLIPVDHLVYVKETYGNIKNYWNDQHK